MGKKNKNNRMAKNLPRNQNVKDVLEENEVKDVLEENEVIWMKRSNNYDHKFVDDLVSRSMEFTGKCDVGGQTLSTLTLTIQCVDIHTHARELICVEFFPWHVEVKIRDIRSKNEVFMFSMAQKIVMEGSSFVIMKDKIVLTMSKAKAGIWVSVFNPPAVMENVRRKFEDYLKLCPLSFDHMEEDFLDDVRSKAEEMSNNGANYVTRLYNLAKKEKTKTPDDVINCIKPQLHSHNFDPQNFLFLATAIFLNERKSYAQVHQDFLRKDSKSDVDMKKRRSESTEKAKAFEAKERGSAHFDANRFESAIEAYTEAIRLDSECALYYLDRSVAYFHVLNYSESVADAAKAIERDPFNAAASMYLSKNFFALDDFTALHHMGSAAFLEPFNAEIEHFLAKITNFQENLEIFSKSIALTSDTPHMIRRTFIPLRNHTSLITQLYREMIEDACIQNHFLEGNEVAQNLYYTENAALQQETFYGFGVCNFYEDVDESAVHDSFRRCLSFTAKHPLAGNNYEFIKRIYSCRERGDSALAAGQFEDAIEWYSQGLKPDVPAVVCSKLFFKLATAKLKLGKREEAIAFLNSAIDKRKDYHEALAKRGECYLKEGKIDEARQDFLAANLCRPCKEYKDLMKKCPENKNNTAPTASKGKSTASATAYTEELLANINLGKNSKGLYPKPRREREKGDESASAIGGNPDEFEVAFAVCIKHQGNVYFRRKMYKDAMDNYSYAIELNPDCAAYFSNRSACHMMLSNYTEGLNDAIEAVTRDVRFVKAYIRMGRCYVALGKVEEGIAAFEKARGLDATNENAVKGIEESLTLKQVLLEANDAFQKKRFQVAADQFGAASKIACADSSLLGKISDSLIRLQRQRKDTRDH